MWGRSRLPVSEADFGAEHFQVQELASASSAPDKYLPVAHTCFFMLELPLYSSAAVLRERLLYAIEQGSSIVDDDSPQQANRAQWAAVDAGAGAGAHAAVTVGVDAADERGSKVPAEGGWREAAEQDGTEAELRDRRRTMGSLFGGTMPDAAQVLSGLFTLLGHHR